MSKKIDITQELSDADRAYLESRGRHDLLKMNQQIMESSEIDSDALAGTAGANDADSDSSGDQDDAGAPEEVPYDDLTKSELIEECKARDLDASGTKAELIERLEQDDAEQE